MNITEMSTAEKITMRLARLIADVDADPRICGKIGQCTSIEAISGVLLDSGLQITLEELEVMAEKRPYMTAQARQYRSARAIAAIIGKSQP